MTGEVARATIPDKPACPRCGYDQRGAVSAWGASSCPIAGTCSECGLTFEWSDLLSPMRAVPRLFELKGENRKRAMLWSIWYATWCWPLWTRLAMHHPIRRGRILLFALAICLAWYCIAALPWFCVSNASEAYNIIVSGTGNVSITRWRMNDFRFDALTPLSIGGDRYRYDKALGSSWVVMYLLQWAFMPLTFLLLPYSLRQAKVQRRHLLRGAGYSIAWMVPPLFIVSVFWHIGDWLFDWNGPLAQYDTIWNSLTKDWMIVVVCAVLASIWWAVFAGRYLKLPRAWLIGLLLGLVSTLTAFLIALVGSRGYMLWDLV
jgi:hypothetical protein